MRFLDALRRADIAVISAATRRRRWSWRGSSARRSCCLTTSCRGSAASYGLQKLAAESPDSELVVLAARFDPGSGVRAVLAGAAG